MRRFLKVITSFVLATLLAACGGGGDEISQQASVKKIHDRIVVSWGRGQIALVDEAALEVYLPHNKSKFSGLQYCQKQKVSLVSPASRVPFKCYSMEGFPAAVELDLVHGVLYDYSGTSPIEENYMVDPFTTVATNKGVFSILPDPLNLEFTTRTGTRMVVGASRLPGVGSFNWIQQYQYSEP